VTCARRWCFSPAPVSSAKLDSYRFGGDSLQGRYHLLRLHPLSVAELGLETSADLKQLLALGGFPEPFFGGSMVEARRWSREYRARLVREDIASLERVQDLDQLELLAQRLPVLVGSPLSVNALREDLQVSHPTVEAWLGALERTYAIFRLAPLGLPRVRAVKKQRKHYHMDWSLVSDAAARFENLVACHLLKWVQFEEDTQGRDLELRYFRDRDGREVDFVVTEDGRPILLVEAKQSDTTVDASLPYLLARCPGAVAWQVSATGKKSYRTPEGVRVAPVIELLKTLI
jgi:predicted AAA+ superfamily ATPase